MNLDELCREAAKLFPTAVEHALHNPGERNASLDELNAKCWVHFRRLGFNCMAECFDAVVPKSEGQLTLHSWSEAEIKALPWILKIRSRPFHLTEHFVHLELHHKGPLPGVTETGYRSAFVPIASLRELTLEDFVRNEMCRDLPKSFQMDLF
jgi:hypothetical protein